MKVFVDTNVFLSAYAFGGVCRELLETEQMGLVFVTSAEVVAELRSRLVSKGRISRQIADEICEELRDYIEPQIQSSTLPLPDVRDPKDVLILLAALGSAAEVLITGDKDLLVLEKVGKMEILTPR